ncbi:Alkaline phosphatase 4 precursor [Caloramator mitchellensis]|uniref:Alkaline phosphatase 4 n=1 Tax=Caloramator mitchellensis TaxID=908809 RepID=A0A0R3K3N6_CALMK|nr:alkaline phosphatase [Caloramator mitchellensis]KRQ87669.1 Alkaline phosphatase 4 precursor [Caloramator mitchellensis]
MSKFKKVLSLLLSAVLIFAYSSTVIATPSKIKKKPIVVPQTVNPKLVKNVIFLIPDGTSISHITLTRWYNFAKYGKNKLAVDEIATGLVKTYWSDGIITDSAPAGSAMATGFKTYNKYISVLPEKISMPGIPAVKADDIQKPIATVLEAAKLAGKSTGLVVTCEIPHATPASFSSHYYSRSDEYTLVEQQVYQNIDVVLGGGLDFLDPAKRKDKEDLLNILKKRGYQVVTTPEELSNAKSQKLWGLFAPVNLNRDFDRDPSKQPSLYDMTKKAIEILSKDKDGFFLMVEGSMVDWSSHSNDPIGVISEFLAFDKAVEYALNFAKRDKNTLVIVAPDHGNGGLSIGSSESNSKYDKMPLSDVVDTLTKAKITATKLYELLNKDMSISEIKTIVGENYGIIDLTDEEANKILDYLKSPPKGVYFENIVGPMISKRACIGWTTTGHTGEDVPLYVYHPRNVRLSGVVQNTDLAKYIAEAMNVSLDSVSKKLFVSAKSIENKVVSVNIDTTDANNPVLKITTNSNKIIILPVYKDYAILNNKEIKLSGITICTNLEKVSDLNYWFFSEDVVKLIK